MSHCGSGPEDNCREVKQNENDIYNQEGPLSGH